MPSKYSIKEYIGKSYYHVFNRGVEKRVIFQDDLDRRVFLNYLKVALSPELEDDTKAEVLSSLTAARLRRLNLYRDIELQAFCLIPNHFHLLLYQKTEHAIRDLMRSIMTGYVMYFNRRYQRVGGLFQGRYKASRIDNQAYLWHISRYIHLNPLDLGEDFASYAYSSFPYFIGEKQAEWVRPKRLLAVYKEHKQNYEQFVNDYIGYKQTLDEIKHELADS